MPGADDLKDQGIQQFMQHDYEKAAATFREAIAAYDGAGAADMAAEQRVNLGLALHSLGQHDAALDQMQQAHAVFAQMGDTRRTAQALGNMARVYAKLDNTEQALTHYREASALFMEIGDEDSYGQTVLAIADLQLRSGSVMQAATTFEVGLDYVKQPNARQKLMKKLLGLRNRATGMGAPTGDDTPPEGER
jgi:tetratricopeptide (TPR) repeat protein